MHITSRAGAWVKLLPDIGNKRSMKNFSPDYPLNCLKDGDAAYIADAVTEIFFDEEQFDDALDFFFSTLQEPLEVGLNACAKAHGKEVDDLSDDEIADVVGKLTDLYMEELVHALMVAQKAPEILAALHSGKEKLTAHGDFNPSVKENRDKINFEKHWTHSDERDCRPTRLWLTRSEASDASVREQLKPLYGQYRARRYRVVVFESGTGDLPTLTQDLPRHSLEVCDNREQERVCRQKQKSGCLN